jgi:ribonucleoside-diphosphate reductase alpha chain
MLRSEPLFPSYDATAGVSGAAPSIPPTPVSAPAELPALEDPRAPLRRLAPETGDVRDTVTWTLRRAEILGADGVPVFAQDDVQAPASWTDGAVRVVASRYFMGQPGTPEREGSVWTLITRVTDTIAAWAEADGAVDAGADALAFRDDLRWMALHQHAAFNSPVWFNVGVQEEPQCSACFINGVEDSMDSILELGRTEGRLFKHGSGSGANLSRLRGDGEPLGGGGTASGPLAFMRGLDAMAGAIKSGGRTRRAARMVMLDDTHPDLLDFIGCKVAEEDKARALIAAGWDGSFGVAGGAYESVAFQNANHTVRLSDGLMEAARDGRDWSLTAVTTGEPLHTMPAKELLGVIAQAAWACGDPGVQFSDTVNRWHTCPSAGPIRASNPCGEFVFLDDSACNLSSLNLLRFLEDDGSFDVVRFEAAVERLVVAMDVLVDRASYPLPRAAQQAHTYRPLGLGFTNLGALLMSLGLPYDSDEGRAMAAALSALMSGAAWRASGRLADRLGPFEGLEGNRAALHGVLQGHADALPTVPRTARTEGILDAAAEAWRAALTCVDGAGWRNAQVSLLAPTGTISFMMDCDTTGVEPELALTKTRRLAGGGILKVENASVGRALRALGLGAAERAAVLAWLQTHGTLEGAPGLAPEHLAVFDCAFSAGGRPPIAPMGHLSMMAAVQPFLCGAISKTVNLESGATVDEIQALMVRAWELGLKSMTIYRDGSKGAQVLETGNTKAAPVAPPTPAPSAAVPGPVRRRLPDTRQGLTHKFSVGGHDGYLTVGLYDDGTPGEIFLVMAKEGSVVSGLVNVFSTSVSMALQYGVPLSVLCDKFSHTRFEPSGFTGNPEIPMAASITDYVFRWLRGRFGDAPAVDAVEDDDAWTTQSDAPPCPACGALMARAGSCYRCDNCGGTSGCS